MPKTESNASSHDRYVLDSYALMAYFEAENGAGQVGSLLESAAEGKNLIYMCVINLGEILYITERERGLPKAQEILAIIDELPVEIIDADRRLTLSAAHIKKECPVAYADCFAAALSQVRNAPLVTGDPEFHKIKAAFDLQIKWLGDRQQTK
jgi:ribonuclease VapC